MLSAEAVERVHNLIAFVQTNNETQADEASTTDTSLFKQTD